MFGSLVNEVNSSWVQDKMNKISSETLQKKEKYKENNKRKTLRTRKKIK